jgi:hypothetical protein
MYIELNGITIPVILKDTKQLPDAFAQFCYKTESIQIRRNVPTALKRKTLVHECFHAFLYLTGYNELMTDISSNFEEALTRGFEQAFGEYFVFPDEIEKWLVE